MANSAMEDTGQPKSYITVVSVDDHPLLREGIHSPGEAGVNEHSHRNHAYPQQQRGRILCGSQPDTGRV